MKHVGLNQIELLFDNLEIMVDENARHNMAKYVNLLVRGNKRSRLTGERTRQGIIEKQVYDSLYPLKYLDLKKGEELIDLGTGGGLPGIPIKIIRPDLILTLLDSNRKKALFLKETIDVLGLNDVCVINKRAEEIGQELEHREKYKYVFCRAVAKMAVLAELSLPLLANDGEAVLYKGPGGDNELDKAEKAISICGGVLKMVEHYTLKTGEERKLYIIKKINNTPGKYPRKPGMPGKKPLIG